MKESKRIKIKFRIMVILKGEGEGSFLFLTLGDRFMFVSVWFLIHIYCPK